ncbi:MAG TPA: glycosyltransferase family 4 protein [Tetrasphaera sp.]|nr:glycosyltransferase family 4 protein [Tetrasphaera sp.]
MTPASSAALRVAIIGPAHPVKGGVTVHTTELAHQLADAGHEVEVLSWSRMYPGFLYPGEVNVDLEHPETPLFEPTTRDLAWNRPDSWVRAGRGLGAYDLVVFVHVIPQLIPAYLAMIAAIPGGEPPPRLVVLAHNVLPHEPRPGDERLVKSLFAKTDAVLVHTPQQASLARSLGAETVRSAALPPHLPGGNPVTREPYAGPARLLALGLVRPYKGIADLVTALAQVPGPTLTVAGEAWGDAGAEVARAAALPGVEGRVTIRSGYVPADDLAGLLAQHDVLALTYRTATASQNALLAHKHGLAVLATSVGSFPQDVRDEVDGLLVPARDQEALVAVLRRLADPDVVAQLRAGVEDPDLTGPWANYVAALETLAALDLPEPEPSSVTWRDRVRGAVVGLKPRVEVEANDLPDWITPTDILGLTSEADDARDVARRLGLPRRGDRESGWAALGGLAAVLRVRDSGRTALIVDQSGPRSPFASWAKAIGFAPVEVATGEDLDVDPGSIDVLTRLHPRDAEAGDIGDLFGQATWALRPGGLLITTIALGPATAPGVLGPADLRGVLAHADNAGLRLVGDLDGDLTRRMRRAASVATDPDAAYGLARLTWRRR